MTYYAIHKPTGKRYDIPEWSHDSLFQLIQSVTSIPRSIAEKTLHDSGRIESKVIIFCRAGGPIMNGVRYATVVLQ